MGEFISCVMATCDRPAFFRQAIRYFQRQSYADAELIVVDDGAHPVGLMPVNVKEIGCDFYVTSGQKWLCGPPGTGLLYVRSDHLERLEPFVVADAKILARPDAQRLNYVWTNNLPGIVGLGAAIDFHRNISAEKVFSFDLNLIRRFNRQAITLPDVDYLSPTEPQFATPMTTLRSRRLKNTEVFQRLKGMRITIKEVVDEHLRQPMNAFRVATHIFNSADEVDRLVEGLRKAL